ncbi:MAG: putative viral replication protein [Cressdnaviricota sp.]|nr:MAG: putative viral replication protein [Cressdnaviricota sp.]
MTSISIPPKGASNGQYRHWCYTFYPDSKLEPVNMKHPEMGFIEFCRFCTAQLEKCPETGRYHFQGYFECNDKKTLAAMKKIDGLKGAHWSVRAGTQEQAIDYCHKEDSRVPVEQGGSSYTFGSPSKGSGQRTDLESATADIVAGVPLREFVERHPVAYVKYARGLDRLRTILAAPVITPTELEPRTGWQTQLIEAVTKSVADKRTIHWVSDPQGHSGKSTMAELLIRNHGAVFLNGRLGDMAHQYNYEPIVCFDMTRTVAEHSDHLYSFTEMLKNGIISSPKYESTSKVFFDKRPHVVFFSNTLPMPGKWTSDRLKLYEASTLPFFSPITTPMGPKGPERPVGAKRPREG